MNTDRLAEQSLAEVAEGAPDLEFTGERIVPGKTAEALFREHEERYVFAGQYVAGKDVLDVACGTGVGTSFLRQAGAHRAWGLDIDPEAIAFARTRYRDCEFARCEATDLCLADSLIDVVVSFETIEHVKDQQKFIFECNRVLRPGGLLICSTPNTRMYRWQGVNPFHKHELTSQEFERLLGEHFGELNLFSQAARFYPVYLLRLFASLALGRVGLRDTVLRMLGRKPAEDVFRVGFVEGMSGPSERITRYRSSFLIQPMYLIAVARKLST